MATATRHPEASVQAELERLLTVAAAEGGPFHPATLARLDRDEAFPDDCCALLDTFGLQQYYVPARNGGRLADVAAFVALLRTVARHDLTVAVAHAKTLLGAVCVWVAGSPEQTARTAAAVRDGAVVSWALTERHHGSDLLAGELTATRTADGWRLDGEKWLINNATRGDQLCVLARTDPAGGARGYSVFLVDKAALAADQYTHLPKVPTHGIRGADISGISFTGARLPQSALVGAEGTGLETVLKALQLTRTVCTALSLGAGDHALRLAAGFATRRELYGRTLADLPRVRQILGRGLGALLLNEAVAVVAARAAGALPGELVVTSAVAKAFVPATTQETLDSLGELIGLRAFLTEEYAHGMFGKLERDHRVAGIFDGSTPVNRSSLIQQFGSLARGYAAARADERGTALAAALTEPVADLDLSRLKLVAAKGCSLVQSLPATVRRCAGLVEAGLLPAPVLEAARRIETLADRLHTDMAPYVPAPRDVPAAAFRLAERYEAVFAAAACLHLAVHNQDRFRPGGTHRLWRDGLWLRACLGHVLRKLGEDPGTDAEQAYGELAALLAAEPDGTFSLLHQDTESTR
ncbi:acyl-CoA dehydrogenase family protein [Streptomyces sp. NPDC017056]|uniref:acyl-CoA dehydrogenase family protein n=1 Tax=Streptomyces sp. NPDC017056 TaxID=3364973 RepID=UPI0037B7DBA7